MIRPEKYKNALQAFQGVVVHARTLAYESAPYKTIAGILDAAEYLPFLIAKPTDETDRFRRNLEDIAAKYHCPFVVQLFDRPVPKSWQSETDPPVDEQSD